VAGDRTWIKTTGSESVRYERFTQIEAAAGLRSTGGSEAYQRAPRLRLTAGGFSNLSRQPTSPAPEPQAAGLLALGSSAHWRPNVPVTPACKESERPSPQRPGVALEGLGDPRQDPAAQGLKEMCGLRRECNHRSSCKRLPFEELTIWQGPVCSAGSKAS
jgi:hypothetical protein